MFNFNLGFSKQRSKVSFAAGLGSLQFLGVGHSYVRGILSGLGVTDNSYRREMYYRWRTKYRKNYTFVGSVTGGDIPTPYHNGVSGEDSAGLNAAIDGYLDAAFVTPTTSDCVLMGPIGFADCLHGVTLATFNSNLDSIINKIHIHSPLIKIFVITDPDCPYVMPDGRDINDYAAEVRTVYNDALAAGKNVYLIDCNLVAINIGPDDIHPDYLGYEQMGEAMTDSIAVSLGISAVSNAIVLQDPFADTNGVLLKNHIPDINTTGNSWLDANDRFDIQSNYAHGIGGYSMLDTVFDINQVVYEGQIKIYQSMNACVFVVLKSNDAQTAGLIFYLDATANKIYIKTHVLGAWAEAAFNNSLSTWYTFNIVIRGNSVEIFDEAHVSLVHTVLMDYGNSTKVGFAYYPPSNSRIDDLLIKY